jgi:Ca2+-binding EF-hand superfamily protein
MESVAREAGIAAPSEADVNEVLAVLDADHSGTIDVNEFKALIVEVLKALQ